MSQKEEKLSFEDKLQYIEKEIILLHKFCLDSGFTPSQIEKSASPFLSPVDEAVRQGRIRKLVWMSIVVAVVGCVLHVDPVYRSLLATTRLAAIKILPYWDWTQIGEWECLVNNPVYEDFKLTEEDCEVCKDVLEVERVSGINYTDMTEFLKSEQPVVVEDGLSNWPEGLRSLSVAALSRIYQSHPVIGEFEACNFKQQSSLSVQSHVTLLQKAQYKQMSWYIAHWENCVREVAKAFRELYKRPYFLPQMVEITSTNWVFVSKGNAKNMLELPITQPLIIYMQVKGQTKIKLKPREPCSKICHNLDVHVKAGEVMVIPLSDILWNKFYQPGVGENIAIGVGGVFD